MSLALETNEAIRSNKPIKIALAAAEQKLERHYDTALRLEKENILQTVKRILSSAEESVLNTGPRDRIGAPKEPKETGIPMLSWPKNRIPKSLKFQWRSTTQLSSEPSQSPIAQSMSPSTPSITTDHQDSSLSTSQSEQLSQINQNHAPVPVINLNLPPGEKLPPGRYALDGSVVPDAKGQLDFVGNLVPVSPPGVL
jgi:hypothetical protein